MKSKFLYLEIIAAAVAVVGAIFANKPMLPSALNMVVLLTYALGCYLISIAIHKNNPAYNKIELFIHKLSWMGLSIMAVGILFKIQHYPGANTMLMVGFVTGIIPFIYHLVNIGKDKEPKDDSTITPPPFNQQDNGQDTTPKLFINKLLGDAKYNHTEMLIRLGLALLIVAKLWFFTNRIQVEIYTT